MTARRFRAWAACCVLVAGSSGCGNSHDPPLERARSIVADASNFGTGREAGDTMARVAAHMLDQARRCIDAHGDTPYCLSFRSAAAWSNVAAVKALTCRAPGRATLRRHAIALFDALEKLPRDARSVPRNPPLPDCG